MPVAINKSKSSADAVYLDIRGTCERFGFCDSVCRRLIWDDPTFPMKKVGGRYLGKVTDLDEWFANLPKFPGKAGGK